MHYGDNQSKPFCGIGFIVRYMSDNTTYYTPVVFPKGTFNQLETSAETQGEEVDFQTQELVFNIMKDDTSNHDWKLVGGELASESAAEAIVQKALGIAQEPVVTG